MSTLSESRKLLVLPGSSVSFAEYLVLVALIKKLIAKGTEVSIAQAKPFPQNFTSVVSFPEVRKIDKLPPRKFILSFDKGSDVVKNIQWQQSDQKINFHISMEKGQFKPEGLNLDIEGADFDTILYYRVNSFAEVQQLFADFPGIVHEVKNVTIAEQFTINNAKVELVDFAEASNFTEKAHLAVKQLGLDSESASILLAAIIGASSRFKTNVGRKSFSYAAELVTAGASIEMANNLLERSQGGSAKSTPQGTEKPEAKNEGSKPTTKPSSEKPAVGGDKPQSNNSGNKQAGAVSATRI
ncbi:hypothetical protein KC640_02670 [Candidatus Dojkabacteria bacterium]|uniref:Uncharacterized protein n=1 Tax=Candidatus Dojkabacteria bacterium TaxID=2099670 RepID=A0A955KYZ0_9BACT|nr:hypothetical protein [Candidatus Dojkabacteria bacterium]